VGRFPVRPDIFRRRRGPGGIVLFALGGLLTQLLCRRLVAQLGGLTGDTYGATNEIVEVAVLFMFFPVYKLTGLHFFTAFHLSVF
jgi:Cobalamin-5-phosphate synthase.